MYTWWLPAASDEKHGARGEAFQIVGFAGPALEMAPFRIYCQSLNKVFQAI